MPSHVALLRGINVGGRNMVAMAKLREMFEALGFSGVQSLLQSGNVVFDGGRKSPAALERLLEGETAKRLGVAAAYSVRSAEEWRKAIAANPYAKEAKADPSHLVVMFLKQPPSAANMKALAAAIRGPESLQAAGRELYVVYPAGIGTSKLTNAVIERTLGVSGTARNWNTVTKLDAMLSR